MARWTAFQRYLQSRMGGYGCFIPDNFEVLALAPAARRLGESQELFNMQCLRVALRSSPRGSGAAVGGGRFEHWKALLGHDSAIEAMHAVCVRLAQGRVPESIAAAIGLSKLAPLRKAGGGVRPIAAPNILRRLVGRKLFDVLDDTVIDFTESNPFGDVGSST